MKRMAFVKRRSGNQTQDAFRAFFAKKAQEAIIEAGEIEMNKMVGAHENADDYAEEEGTDAGQKKGKRDPIEKFLMHHPPDFEKCISHGVSLSTICSDNRQPRKLTWSSISKR